MRFSFGAIAKLTILIRINVGLSRIASMRAKRSIGQQGFKAAIALDVLNYLTCSTDRKPSRPLPPDHSLSLTGGRRFIQSKSRTVMISAVMIQNRIPHITAAARVVIFALVLR